MSGAGRSRYGAGGSTGADGATPRPDGGSETDLVVEHIRNVLRAYRADDHARRRRARELERAGYRIVDGGQTGTDSWAIHDWRTGQVLAAGDYGSESDDLAARERLDPHRTWFHYDWLADDIPLSDVPVSGLPPSLALAVENWIGRTSTPDAEIAEFIDWPVQVVRDCRA